jgi:hypothetical protein
MITNTSTSTNAVLIPIIRQIYPALFAQDLISVQPMTGPIGNIFTLKPTYSRPKIQIYCGSAEAELDWSDSNDSVNHTDMSEWCEQQFGPHPKNPDTWSRWYQFGWGQFRFRDERDYMLFLLRWA